MSHKSLSLAVSVSLLALLPTDSSAQLSPVPEGFGLGATVGYFTLKGGDFQGIQAGLGFEGYLRETTSSGFHVLYGVHYSIHSVDGAENKLSVFSLFVDPRFAFSVGSPTPFIGARLAYVRTSIVESGADYSTPGYVVGGLGGFLFQVSPKVAIEATVLFAAVSLSATRVDGTLARGTGTSGSTLAVQAGAVVSFPR